MLVGKTTNHTFSMDFFKVIIEVAFIIHSSLLASAISCLEDEMRNTIQSFLISLLTRH